MEEAYMAKVRVPAFLLCGVIILVCLWSSALDPKRIEPSEVRIRVESVERVSSNTVRFRVKLLNTSATPVFLEARAQLRYADPRASGFAEQLFLEQQTADGWKVIVPCLEEASSHVIRLDPGKELSQDRELKDPIIGVCKERHLDFAGKFRFRLSYFLSEKAARNDEKNFGRSETTLPAARIAVSEPFEIKQPKQ